MATTLSEQSAIALLTYHIAELDRRATFNRTQANNTKDAYYVAAARFEVEEVAALQVIERALRRAS